MMPLTLISTAFAKSPLGSAKAFHDYQSGGNALLEFGATLAIGVALVLVYYWFRRKK
ncbi:MAG: hypothetical protein RRB13_05670 [bacterium]|nr:hypothetical protein [bacterium]